MLGRLLPFVFLLSLVSGDAFAALPPNCVPGKVDQFLSKHRSERTGYFPDDSEMEGGFNDRVGNPLRTLQQYLAGKAKYVSVAMDHEDGRLPYGTVVRIPAVELVFKRCIEFRVVDTGGRFEGRGTDKVDICNNTEEQTLQPYSNGMADLFIISRKP